MPSLSLRYDQLRDLLTPVLPLAHGDGFYPVLAGVMIEARGRDTVLAYATDRFRVGMSRVKIEPAPKARTFRALLGAKELRVILADFKPGRRPTKPPTLTLAERAGRVTVTSDQPNGKGLRPAYTLDVVEGEFPQVLGILREAHENGRDATTWTAVRPDFLADFRHAVRSGFSDTMLVRPGATPRKPVAVAVGEHFLGAVMPRHLAGTDYSDPAPQRPDVLAESWADVFPPAELEAKAS